MRKVILLVIGILGSTTALFAQKDAKAKTILAEVSKKYRSYNVIRTEFTYAINNPQANVKETKQGTFFVQSNTNKYKIMLDDQELMSDGKSQWTYLKDDKEVQINEVDNSPNALNPAKIYTIYEKGYKYIYLGDTKSNGLSYHTIDLTPIDSKSSFFKIRLSIGKLNKQIKSAVIFDKNGSRYTYTINSFTSTVKISDSFFSFDKKNYPGVEIVDLR